MKTSINTLFAILFAIIILQSCDNKHFITDSNYRTLVEKQFEKQKELAKNRSIQLFSVFDQKLSLEEKEALQFLYAYMPLNDLADNDGNFFLRNVKTTFEAKKTFPWCKTIPEDIFRHFVLPIRVNNEDLDSARIVFYKELKDRVKNLSMKEAALEVNHWCLEKVTYRPADPRTSSPLNTVKSAYGRCGEESTFYVAALRAVGIPARQCYTPRWAATDDNHAWVELWIDGKWYFAGACEPACDLNMGWFSAPVKRAMLVNTNVFGNYQGSEEVLLKTDYYTKINVLSNYTEVKTIYIKALNDKKQAIDSAEVNFGLYNYAEFFPLSKKFTNKNGICSFTTGMGDLLIWANKNNQFAFEKFTVSKTDTLTLIINKNPSQMSTIDYDLVPPIEKPATLTNKKDQKKLDSKIKENDKRWAKDDSIRKIYTSTFMDSIKSLKALEGLNYNTDSLRKILEKTNGNWQTILKFIKTESKYNAWKLPLLYSIQDKDLRDISFDVLIESLENSFSNFGSIDNSNKENFINYVLCPRIYWERTTCYKQFFQKEFKPDFVNDIKKDITNLTNWINKNIAINTTANYYNVALSPKGCYELKVADKLSRDILFVAICRSFGIIARIEPATMQVQYFKDKQWVNIYFETLNKEKAKGNGFSIFENDNKIKDFKPQYSIHFSIGKYNNGKYTTLDYENSDCFKSFPAKIELEAGNYILITGFRLKDGSVLSKLSFFDVNEGKSNNVKITLREQCEEIKPIGQINTDNILYFNNKTKKLSELANEKLCVLAWIDTEKEPTKHYLNECQDLKVNFEKWGGNFTLLFPDEAIKKTFNKDKFKNLPKTTNIGVDKQNTVLQQIEKITKTSYKGNLPVVIVINNKCEILYLSSGYSIGIGERVLKTINTTCSKNKSCTSLK
ncbi:MAG: transglutaminase-like domain-containing protein [Bacteroidota bacterium]